MNKFTDYRSIATLTGVVLVMFVLLFVLPSTRPVRCAADHPQCEFLKEKIAKIAKPRNKAERDKREVYCDRMKELNCSEYESVCGSKSGFVDTDVSISGEWKADIGYEYEITQTGNKFSWSVTNKPDLHETATGHFTEKNKVTATWENTRGKATADGTVVTDSNGLATEISWTNGIHFRRK
jgi:hypothetical protein